MNLRHEFVEYMPEEIKEGILYISIPFGTMIHKCGCGCGEKVVTPLGPAEWKFTYDGKTISVHPSVGNWGFPCRSHYCIDRSHVRWARSFTKKEVLEARTKTKEYRRDLALSDFLGTLLMKVGKETLCRFKFTGRPALSLVSLSFSLAFLP